jgi:hypothetical protein
MCKSEPKATDEFWDLVGTRAPAEEYYDYPDRAADGRPARPAAEVRAILERLLRRPK